MLANPVVLRYARRACYYTLAAALLDETNSTIGIAVDEAENMWESIYYDVNNRSRLVDSSPGEIASVHMYKAMAAYKLAARKHSERMEVLMREHAERKLLPPKDEDWRQAQGC